MNKLKLDKLVAEGGRLLPGISHIDDPVEIVRHKSTYKLFTEIIIKDLINNPMMLKKEISILDIGCGSGHGSYTLSLIPNSFIYAMDQSSEALDFARWYYNNDNIKYFQSSVEDFVLNNSKEFDYIVTRHALEHVKAGVDIVLPLKFTKRMMISVPYMEPENGTIHHLHFNINESNFKEFVNYEFIFEGRSGINDLVKMNDERINSFTCISSSEELSKVKDIIKFPYKPYEFKGMEKILVDILFEQ